ncbi:Kinesin-Like Protein Kif19 [Manis pentadactyla]|nr:Kinesin-Like Protein Kif19 [Manis pentadactyla]
MHLKELLGLRGTLERTVKRNWCSEKVSDNGNALQPLLKPMETSGRASSILFLIRSFTYHPLTFYTNLQLSEN